MSNPQPILAADERVTPPVRVNGPRKVLRAVYDLLASVKLAMALLIAILICCIVGVTVYREARAGEMIFATLWFNALLVLLVVNVAFCFFGRVFGRRLTLVSLGMILFHLSFVVMLGGVIYNSLFYFRGFVRLTEGEALPSGKLESYDHWEKGRLFSMSKLDGETKLIKMHRGYRVDGVDKRAAYEISVGEGSSRKQGIIYVTKNLDHRGFRYFCDREGYAPLIILYDMHGRELYGAYVPLQSLKQKDGTYFYTSGTAAGPGSFPFPQHPAAPLFALQVNYRPSSLQFKEQWGDAFFHVWPLARADGRAVQKSAAEGKAAVGRKFKTGIHALSVKEVRYWVAMSVRYDPGLPIVLGSFWAGLGGMLITFIGRMGRSRT
jgi:hypothetical protein